MEQYSRTINLIGCKAQQKIRSSRVAIFGLGGVGSYTVEALARAGIGHLTLVDADRVDLSNINRQLCALHSTIGRLKTEVVAERIADIDPSIEVKSHSIFYLPDTAPMIPLDGFDYIVDAIDTVTAKIELIVRAREASVPIISSMGTGNKLDPTLLQIADISKTSICPLARVMRRELRQRGIDRLPVIYSTEPPHRAPASMEKEAEASGLTQGQSPAQDPRVPASISFVPSVAGLMMASYVINSIIGNI